MAKKLRFLFTLLFVMAATLSWGEEVKYTISSLNTLTTTGIAPSGSSASISETYGTTKQMTSGNTQTLKLKNYNGYKITSLKLSMHSNSKGGQAYLKYSTDGGKSFKYVVGSGTTGVAFSNVSWNGSWSTSYVDISKTVEIIPTEDDVVIVLGASANSIYCQSYTITYNKIAVGPVDPTVSFENESVEVEVGSTIANTISKPEDLSVSYESSDESVATVDADGTVTGVDVGSATITAFWADVADKYKAGSKTFAVTVVPAKERFIFEKVTNTNQLLAGNEYILVATEKNVAMGAQNGTYRNPVDVTITDNLVSFVAGEVEVLTLGGVKGAWTFLASDGKYIGLTSNANALHQIENGTSDNAKWTITDDFMLTNVGQSGRTIKYNSSNPRFACYTSGQTDAVLFVKQGSPIYVEKVVNAVSNNEAWGTVTKDGNVITATPAEGYRLADPAYTVDPADAATVVQDGNEFTVTATADCTVTINFKAIPTHTVTFYVNGAQFGEPVSFAEDASIVFPIAQTELYGKHFVGWVTAEIEGTTDDASPVNSAVMGTADVAYYAVYANVTPGTATQVTDELTRETTGVEDQTNENNKTYKEWSGKKATSDAIYAGQSAGDHNSIQLRSNNSNSGIITTTSGGKVKTVSVTWNSNTTDGRTLDVYGSNAHYTTAADLYGDNKGTKLGSIVYGTSTELSITGDYAYIGLRSNSGAMYLDNISITWENGTPATYSDYCTTVAKPVSAVSAPVIFHDEGTYEGALTVAIAGGGTIKYTLNGGDEQTYSAPFTISETTTVKAWTEQDGNKIDEVSKIFTIVSKPTLPTVTDGYYSIKNNGNGKFVNVAGRKTVTFTNAIDDKAGTVIKVKATNGKVEVLRSQGVDLPGYAKKAMNYVPEIVELVVNKLHAAESGEILGPNGFKKIMDKFNESFDYNLYLEKAGEGYRIYGKTPSMKPVVDFYAENKADVDFKLPQLEDFINKAINKVLEKTGGRGQSILKPFSLHEIWEKMGGTLTEPTDEATTAKFYEEVLSSEANVWNFAYQTAMKYWEPLIKHDKVQQNLDKLGDYAKYLEKVENIRPDFKYYIVANEAGNDVDFISEGNTDINAARATWTLESRTDFKVTFNEENSINLGRELYTTLYTDFAYTVPEKVKAYKVTAIDEKTGLATKEEITGVIPAQTPVLLMSTDVDNLTQTLSLSTEAGTAVTGNLLQGPDTLINKYEIKTAQVVSLFDMAKEFLGESAYNTYVKEEYEHLMLKNSGTVNNKYFFGLPADDLKGITDLRVLGLNDAGMKLGFYGNWTNVKANEAFIINANNPVRLTLVGDVTRDGKVDVEDVTAVVNIILNEAKEPPYNFIYPQYDYEAADTDESGKIDVTDLTKIVDLALTKEKTE